MVWGKIRTGGRGEAIPLQAPHDDNGLECDQGGGGRIAEGDRVVLEGAKERVSCIRRAGDRDARLHR